MNRRRERVPWLALLLAGTTCGDEPGSKRPRQAPSALELPPRTGPSPVAIVDATEASGITFVHDYGAAADEWHYAESMGSGVVAFDGDGDADLLFLNGRGFGPRAVPARGNGYYRNEGALRFVDATAAAGLSGLEGGGNFAVSGCAADYDNDGDQDLYVVHFDGGNALYRNDGSGRFSDVAATAGVAGRSDFYDSVCVFGDVDGDGWLDLFVGGCLDQTLARHRKCYDTEFGKPDVRLSRYCNPTDFAPLPDQLFLSNRDGTFRDGTAEAGLADFRGRTLGALFVDLDDDRDADLFVVSDRSANALWINDGHGRFTDAAPRAGVAYDADGRARGGMGVAAGDYDGDGRFDLVATYFERECNGLYRQQEALSFVDVATSANTANASFAPVGWGTDLFDADLDGDLDWMVVNGHVNPFAEQFSKPGATLGWAQPFLFFLNRGSGLFESLDEQAGPAFAQRHPARGLATADFDGDGDLDCAISNNGAPALLLRNDSPRGDRHWLRVRLHGTRGNRDGLGARVIVEAGGRRQFRELHSGGSYFSQNELRASFGLGAAARVERIEVRWPSGRTSELTAVAADQEVVVTEP